MSRRRSFSRRSLPQVEESRNPVEYDQDSSSSLVNSIFRAAKNALALVSRELDFTQDEVAAMKSKLHSVVEEIGSRDGPVESACRSFVALQEGLCPPKRLKTDRVEDFYVRTLQQTLNDWDLSSVQDLLSEMTVLEPLPPIDDALNSAAPIEYEDILGVQLQNTEHLLAEEASFDKLRRKVALDCPKPLRGDRCISTRSLMERFGFYKLGTNKVG